MLSPRVYKEPDYAKWGDPGMRIPDSVFVRAYCGACGEPIRVSKDDFEAKQGSFDCVSCKARLHPGHGSPYYCVDDEDANGGWANVVSAYEN